MEIVQAFDLAVIEVLHKSATSERAHARAHFVWSRTASWVLATIAVTGALAGGSALSDSRTATAVLGVATALLTGLNAGLRPADRAAAHHVAAVGYNSVVHAIEQMLAQRESMLRNDWAELKKAYAEVDSKLSDTESTAPSVLPRDEEIEEADRRTFFLLGLQEPSVADVLHRRDERHALEVRHWYRPRSWRRRRRDAAR